MFFKALKNYAISARNRQFASLSQDNDPKRKKNDFQKIQTCAKIFSMMAHLRRPLPQNKGSLP
jgi:hypothetical protein